MNQTIAFAPVRKTVRVKAPLTRAFEVFTASSWWPREHSILKGTRQQVVLIEPHAGGRWFERGEDGSECDWGKVLAWEPPSRLLLAWQINADFKYDPTLLTEVEILFTARAGGTLVELEHRLIERMGERGVGMRDAFTRGWGLLLESFAKQAV